ncbi:MAG: threo-3-hydroxy-L-aspartate ammonia-lyase [Phycisphaerales bacterium]
MPFEATEGDCPLRPFPDADAPPSEVTFADVRSAARVLEGIARRTPIMTCAALDELVGARVLLKCENFQRVGAFKFRGAYHALATMAPEHRARGVLTYSSGNHAQEIALAGRLLGVRTVIVMPSDAPTLKLAATRATIGESGEVVVYERERISREALGAELAEKEGLTIVPPYDDPAVIAGQGTSALELFEDAPETPEAMYVCVGGGGLVSGCAIAAKGVAPGCRVVGVEPEAGADAKASFETGRLHTVPSPDTIADGARTPYLGRWTFPLIRRHVDAMTTVGDDALVEMMRFCFERLKIVVEPSGVLGLAGLVRDARAGRLGGVRTVGVLISGGNVDAERFARLVHPSPGGSG